MALAVGGERPSLVLRRWSLFGLPLPTWLGPRSESYESAEQGRVNFHVRISHPLTGLIIRYDGWLVRKSGEVHEGLSRMVGQPGQIWALDHLNSPGKSPDGFVSRCRMPRLLRIR
jgi:hypothetical protein